MSEPENVRLPRLRNRILCSKRDLSRLYAGQTAVVASSTAVVDPVSNLAQNTAQESRLCRRLSGPLVTQRPVELVPT